ncbi:MAG: hypothetical protein ACKO37_07005 [Vampirovibrionales bacterium]
MHREPYPHYPTTQDRLHALPQDTLSAESYFTQQASKETSNLRSPILRKEGIRLGVHGQIIKPQDLEQHIDQTTEVLGGSQQKEVLTVPRWYDRIQRLSYGLGVFQSLGQKPTHVMSYIVQESRKGIQRKLEDRTGRLSLDTIHALEKEMAYHNRWYDHFPHYKRAMQNILVCPQEDKMLWGSKWMAMGIVAYEYFESTVPSRLIDVPNERELGTLLMHLQDAEKPLSTLESICKQDLQVILKQHLVRRTQIEEVKEQQQKTKEAPIILTAKHLSKDSEDALSIMRLIESQYHS